MTQASSKVHCHTFHISDLTPDDVIELGYNLFLSSHAPEPGLKSRAEGVVQEFDTFLADLRPELDQSEKLYVMQVQMAANDLARGIARRKDDRNRSLQAAQDKYQEMVGRMAATERWSGILQGGLRLCLLGGVSYILAYVIAYFAFESGGAATQKFAEHKELAALAIALGSTLVGSYFKAWWMNKQVLKVYENFENDRRQAQATYAKAAQQEYGFAHKYASEAYLRLTGKEAPLNNGLRNMVLSLMSDATDLEPVATSASK